MRFRLHAFGPQKFKVQRPAAKEHLVQGVFDVWQQDATIAVALEVKLN